MNKNKDLFFKIYLFMLNELELRGNELMIYAVIYSYTKKSQESCFYGSQAYLGRCLNLTRQSVSKSIMSLIKKKLIAKKTIVINSKEVQAYYCLNVSTEGDSMSKKSTPSSTAVDTNVIKALHNTNNYTNNDKNFYNNIII